MKRVVGMVIGAAGLVSGAAAQSSVTVYGAIDLGVTYYKGGASDKRIDSGISWGSRLGFRGNEDLGGGLTAIFDLEMPILADVGVVPGAVWGREAWLGVKSSTLGTLTMGRQTDFMCDFQVLYSAATFRLGAYGFHPGDYDRVSGQRYDNSVKWVSPALGPVQLGAMVSLGEVAGSTSTRMGKSLGATYRNGPLSASLTYTSTNDQVIDPGAQLGINTLNGVALTGPVTTDRVDILGAGAGYRVGSFWLKALHTRTTLRTATGSPTLKSTDLNGQYDVTPNSFVGAGFAHSSLESNAWKKFVLAYDYQLSKRTDVYVSYVHLKASDGNRATLLALPSSTTDTASTLRVAMRHLF